MVAGSIPAGRAISRAAMKSKGQDQIYPSLELSWTHYRLLLRMEDEAARSVGLKAITHQIIGC